jgi:putative Mn2+ efflux pump MntP
VFDVIVLAFALSMDAFAVSIGLGAKKHQTMVNIALRAGLLSRGQRAFGLVGFVHVLGSFWFTCFNRRQNGV